MTATPPAPPAPRRRRGLLWASAGALVLVLLALALGPRLHASSREGDAAAPLAPAAGAPSATAVAADEAGAALDGTWRVTGGTAGYRVDEVLNGQDVTVTGRTEQVSGSFTVDAGSLTTGEVAVDLASVSTDSGARDGQFRRLLGVEEHPSATFALTAPVPLGGLQEPGSSVSVVLPGTLTINGRPRDVEVPATAALDGAGALTVTGAAATTWSDHGVTAPDLGFVRVEDAGVVEFQVTAARG